MNEEDETDERCNGTGSGRGRGWLSRADQLKYDYISFLTGEYVNGDTKRGSNGKGTRLCPGQYKRKSIVDSTEHGRGFGEGAACGQGSARGDYGSVEYQHDWFDEMRKPEICGVRYGM